MPKGRSEHSKKARRRLRAGLNPRAAKAREQALRRRLEERSRMEDRGRERELTDRARELRERYPGLSKDELAERAERPRTRAEIVAERERKRLEHRAKMQGQPGVAHGRRRRFGANEDVDAGTQSRTESRIKRLGGLPPGIDLSNGVQGREARLARTLLHDKRDPQVNTDRPKRGIGGQVRELAHDKTRIGGIGNQVRELAQRRVQRLHTSGGGAAAPVQERKLQKVLALPATTGRPVRRRRGR